MSFPTPGLADTASFLLIFLRPARIGSTEASRVPTDSPLLPGSDSFVVPKGSRVEHPVSPVPRRRGSTQNSAAPSPPQKLRTGQCRTEGKSQATAQFCSFRSFIPSVPIHVRQIQGDPDPAWWTEEEKVCRTGGPRRPGGASRRFLIHLCENAFSFRKTNCYLGLGNSGIGMPTC